MLYGIIGVLVIVIIILIIKLKHKVELDNTAIQNQKDTLQEIEYRCEKLEDKIAVEQE